MIVLDFCRRFVLLNAVYFLYYAAVSVAFVLLAMPPFIFEAASEPFVSGRAGFDSSTISVLIAKSLYSSDLQIIKSCETLEGNARALARLKTGDGFAVFKFAGSLEVVKNDGEYLLINKVKISDYIACVIISELDDGGDGLFAALAVLIRSLVHKEIIDRKSSERSARHPGSPFLLCARTHCASYRGALGETILKKAAAAVKITGDQILTYKGLPVYSFYSSACSGTTIRASSIYPGVTGDDYLGEFECPCKNGLKKWRNVYDMRQMSGIFGFNVSSIESIGPPWRIVLSGKRTCTFDEFISLIEKSSASRLKSPFFSSETDEKKGAIILNGIGMGHGAGLCLKGAALLSKRGYDYKKILNYYYKSCILKTVEL